MVSFARGKLLRMFVRIGIKFQAPPATTVGLYMNGLASCCLVYTNTIVVFSVQILPDVTQHVDDVIE